MKWARWDSARHSLTIVADGATTRVRAELAPSFSVQLTPPVDGVNLNAVRWDDDTPSLWDDGTTMEWA